MQLLAFSVWNDRNDLVMISNMADNQGKKFATFCKKSNGDICLLSCDSPEPIEYSLLKKYFEVAEKALSGGMVNSKAGRLFEVEDPVPSSQVYCGCMLGVTLREKQSLISEIRDCGKDWCDDIEQDELYIVIGEDLSTLNSVILDHLKNKWQNAKIFTLPGFLNFVKHGVSGDDARTDYNNFIAHCQFVSEGYFKWPSTYAYPGIGVFDPDNMNEIGVLSLMGYHVGKKGLDSSSRRAILRDAYLGAIPFDPFTNMDEWDAPNCSGRLKKIANCIAAFARNAKKRSNAYSFRYSIADWESDLEWLKKEFYIGAYDRPPRFQWPY